MPISPIQIGPEIYQYLDNFKSYIDTNISLVEIIQIRLNKFKCTEYIYLKYEEYNQYDIKIHRPQHFLVAKISNNQIEDLSKIILHVF